MHRNLFLIVLSLIAVFWYDPQNLASSDFADAIPLLTGQSKTQTLNSSSGNPDIALGPNIDKYIKYRLDHNLSCDLTNALWYLAPYKHNWNSFKVKSNVEFHIPEQFIKGIFDDFQNPERVTAIKALIKQSTQRERKEAEEAKAAAALCPDIRGKIFPHSQLEGAANLLIMPNIEAAHISFKMAQALGNDLIIGPILLGIRGSAQILAPTVKVRGIIDMAALAIADASEKMNW